VGTKYDRLLAMTFSLVFLLLVATTNAKSQGQPSPSNNYTYFASSNIIDPPLRMNEINARAMRHFKNHFLQVDDEIWTRTNDFFVATFTEKGIITKVYYHTHGAFAYYVKYYAAISLNPQTRSMIMKKFPDYSIDVVTEVGNLDAQILFIKIKTSSNIKTLQVLNDNIEVTEEYVNGGI
ncbi:MAG TPA: hypothetical protein VFV08_02245, partial [Puia sp.]|nr:hypothetical protein [Puia sp.]